MITLAMYLILLGISIKQDFNYQQMEKAYAKQVGYIYMTIKLLCIYCICVVHSVYQSDLSDVCKQNKIFV